MKRNIRMNRNQYLILVMGMLLGGCFGPSSAEEEVPELRVLSDMQAAVATYMYLPQFSFPEFLGQVFHVDVRSAGYDPVNRLAYFSVPRHLSPEDQLQLESICADPTQIEYAEGYQAIEWLGPNLERDADTSRVVMRFPAKEMVLDSSTVITRKIRRQTVDMSLAELAKSFRHGYAYNAPALALAPGAGDVSYVIANHAAPISYYGDPILQRFVHRLLSRRSPRTREDSIQILLNFVTESISYTHHGDLEIFMRPVDVLMAGEADCSGKVILFGSMLNQIHVPFLLVYLDGHITVGVQGDFPKSNGMFFLHEDQTYTLAETTAEGFVIGKSELIEPMKTWHYKYLQKPGFNNKLYDLWKNDSLEFAERVDLAGYRAPAVK